MGIGRIITEEGEFLIQVLFTIAVISAGIFLQLNFLQWTIVTLLSTVFLFTGFYRNAVFLAARYDDSISADQAVRIKALSNVVLAFITGFSFFTYLLIFMPKINQIL
ncbi:MAG: hypothetical protein P1P86_06825 [Bacteroidales bacterium]|nr:hypothetical protein [Bacteroidales bacterium]